MSSKALHYHRNHPFTALDGENLPAAKRILEDAVHDLCGVRLVRTETGRAATELCLYEQLCDAVTSRRTGHGLTGMRHSEPVSLTAFDLRREIDHQVRSWTVRYPPGDTRSILDSLPGRAWRPQDAPELHATAKILKGWTHRIRHLLDTTSHVEVKAECPTCGARYAWQHTPGHTLRRYALDATTDGCTCRRCGRFWPPGQLELLARVLHCKPLHSTAA